MPGGVPDSPAQRSPSSARGIGTSVCPRHQSMTTWQLLLRFHRSHHHTHIVQRTQVPCHQMVSRPVGKLVLSELGTIEGTRCSRESRFTSIPVYWWFGLMTAAVTLA